jgi:Oxidoreductase molybdopterin binding domain
MALATRPSARQVNLLLETLVLAALATGLASWVAGDRWSGWFVLGHRLAGLCLLVLAPAKLRGSVKAGFRRGRTTRWLSAAFGVLVLATIALGILHASGLWYGVGYWTALWTHELFAFALIPLFLWHLASRPVRPRRIDVNRRAVLGGGVALGVAAAAYTVQQGVVTAGGLAGQSRRPTGSHKVASHDPAHMPSTVWIDDRAPASTDAEDWTLVVAGRRLTVASLRSRARPVVARLDCTGGWWSEQSWDAVPLSDLMGDPPGRSVRVRSATGYDRFFARHELDELYLAVGYEGEQLQARHGAPVRLVVPGRRGYWWVKWVTSVEPDDRPAWLQLPLPLA